MCTERSGQLGDVWLALKLLKKFGLRGLSNEILTSTHAKVPWSVVACVLVIARFCEPHSEVHIAQQFGRTSALANLLGVGDHRIYDNRFFGALGGLWVHKNTVEQHLKERFGELFKITCSMLLSDLPSTYFEEEGTKNPQAQREYSCDHHPDCPQVCIGLVVSKEGIPFRCEVFDGNRHDPKTVQTIVRKMQELLGKSNRVWIMDRG